MGVRERVDGGYGAVRQNSSNAKMRLLGQKASSNTRSMR
jgi:hypothetical protein